MSTNEANIKITVDDSDLVTTDRRLERVEEGLEGVAREARQAGTGLRGVGQAAAGAVAGLVSMEMAKQALSVAINGLRASITAFAESNEEGQRTVDAVSASLDEMKAAFGEAMIGGENAELVIESLNGTFGMLQQMIEDNAELIAELTVSGLDAFGAALAETTELVQDLVTIIETYNRLLGETERNTQEAAVGTITFSEKLLELAQGLPSLGLRTLRGAIDVVAEGMSTATTQNHTYTTSFAHIRDGANDATSGILSFAFAMMNGLDMTEPAMLAAQQRAQDIFDAFQNIGEGDAVTLPRGLGGIDEEAQKALSSAQLFAQAEFERVEALKNALSAKSDARKEATTLLLEEQAVRQQQQLESQAEFLRLTAEQEKLAREVMGQNKLEGQAKLDAATEAQQQRTIAFSQGLAASTQALALAASVGTAKERKKALKKALGQELLQRGGALVAQGIGNAIAMNPMGALQIAGGASMIAAGAKLSGGGGGGGGAPTTATTPPAAINNSTSNVTINQQTQFGFVGDRRAATREIEEINRRSMDRGL